MTAILLYHDVVAPGAETSSGFQGGDADRYKLDIPTFSAHLDAVAARGISPTFTFDDGGVSAIDHSAPLLEAREWRGTFFITTDWIGRRGFLDADQIRALAARGHRIGSHSCSHPPRISSCSPAQLLHEWQRSCAVLETILEAPVTLASVPGGYYSTTVAVQAAAAGIRELHTSEPLATPWQVGPCEVHGRYSITRSTSAALAAALAAGDLGPRLRLAAFWQLKKGVKAVGGEHWLRLRRRLLRNRPAG